LPKCWNALNLSAVRAIYEQREDLENNAPEAQ